ncbi:MAG: flavin mononucleotide hydrolase 1, chloroplatic [Polyangiaceae bacterium]|jgi:HAD superfamily hydrolase (TIGR01509 family)|nr:flavin mononucleotide hydrolase 1, chloroplatic [Polyangiaceae bacterium]
MDTLVRDPFRDVMPSFFGMTLSEMMQLKQPEAWGQFERGELSETQFLDRFFADGRKFDHDEFCTKVRSAYSWLEGMEPLLAKLKARGHTMHVLSNYPVWYRWIEERLALSRYVSWTFMSCRLGLRKPDPRIFERAAAELGVGTGECLFIDDRSQNCDAARAVGMRALRFEGDAAALAAELSRLLPAQQA